jgi:hypothetical protein
MLWSLNGAQNFDNSGKNNSPATWSNPLGRHGNSDEMDGLHRRRFVQAIAPQQRYS